MKLARLFAAALVVGFAFISSAQALPIPGSTLASPSDNGDYGNYDVTAPASKLTTDILTGYLATNSMITITYTAKGVDPKYVSINATGANGLGQTTASVYAKGSPLAVYTDPTIDTYAPFPLLIVSTAGIDLGLGEGKVMITNLSSTMVANISSVFKILVSRGSDGEAFNVSWNVTSVPLPPAFLLFASGLIALVGFSLYKRAYGRV
jgi:hypothetical protein